MAKHLFLPPISYTSKRVSSYASIKSGNMILVRTIALFNQHNYFAVFLINYMSHNTRGVITCYFLAPFSSIPTVWHTVCANKSHSLKRPMHTTYVIGKINESNHCKKHNMEKMFAPIPPRCFLYNFINKSLSEVVNVSPWTYCGKLSLVSFLRIRPLSLLATCAWWHPENDHKGLFIYYVISDVGVLPDLLQYYNGLPDLLQYFMGGGGVQYHCW